jgi:hypothetical protein
MLSKEKLSYFYAWFNPYSSAATQNSLKKKMKKRMKNVMGFLIQIRNPNPKFVLLIFLFSSGTKFLMMNRQRIQASLRDDSVHKNGVV